MVTSFELVAGAFVFAATSLLDRQSAKKRGEKDFISPRPWWSGLGLIRRAPGHGLQRFHKVDIFGLIERPEDPGIVRADKASTIGNKAAHSVPNTGVFVPAGVDAIVLSPASHVIQVHADSV